MTSLSYSRCIYPSLILFRKHKVCFIIVRFSNVADGNGVSYKVVKGQVIAKTPFIGYLSQLCFSAVGIIVTVVIFAAGVVIMMYVNKISKEINTMVEQQTA